MRRPQWCVRRVAGLGVVVFLATSLTGQVARGQFPAPEVTPEHKLLRKDVGVWDAEMRLFMGGPDAEPMVSKGVERNRMLGDLWLVSNFTADLGGQEFQGHGQFGYDPRKKKFVGTWIENMGAHISTMEGDYDEAAAELTMVMDSIDPQTGAAVPMKTVSKYIGDDKRLFTMYMKSPEGGGEWVKSMEIHYTRRPDGARKKPIAVEAKSIDQ